MKRSRRFERARPEGLLSLFYSALRPASVCVLAVFLSFEVAPVYAQQRIQGTVIDAATGETLPGATVQIEGTFTGTVANAVGRFSLGVPAFPVSIVTRFIGYESDRRQLQNAASGLIDIHLIPVAIQLPEITVSGEDPAIGIMRRVIEEKARWRDSFDTYKVDAYNRFRLENDSGIVSIWESGTVAFWDRERGTREISVWQRQTDNMDIDELLPAALFVQNLYDDDINVAGHRFMGVTHPDALSYYDFHLSGSRARDNQLVYDIEVQPKSKLGSGFVGTIAVLDSAYAMLEVDLAPGEAFFFPPPIKELSLAYHQQFSRFGSEVWLPVDFRLSIRMDISFMGLITLPTIRIEQISRLSDFELNVPLPDSLYALDEFIVADSTALAAMDIAELEIVPVPLTPREEVAYETIDSTMTLAQAYRPTGPLARFAEVSMGSSDGDDSGSSGGTGFGSSLSLDLEPLIWYNRVEGLHAGLEASKRLGGDFRLTGQLGYETARKGWTYGVSARVGRRTWFEGGFVDHVPQRYTSDLLNRFWNSANVLAAQPDYFDYLHERKWFFGGGGRIRGVRGLSWSLTYADLEQSAVTAHVRGGLFGGRLDYLENAEVGGNYQTITARIEYEGADSIPLGIGPEYTARIEYERDFEPGNISDSRFARLAGMLAWRFPTFYTRRLIPNSLDIRISGQTATKYLPRQWYGIVDASTVFGGLNTLHDRPYEGRGFVSILWEHSFRSVPFERLGWKAAARKGLNFIIHGAHARVWSPAAGGGGGWNNLEWRKTDPRSPDGFHHEIGYSISGLFDLFRVDFTHRLDKPGFAIGVSAARIF